MKQEAALTVALRTEQEDDGRWLASAYSVSAPLTKSTAYGGTRKGAIRAVAGIVLEDYAQMLLDGETDVQSVRFAVDPA